MSEKVVAKECRFAIHIPAIEYGGDDYHLVKEVLHYENGETKPNIRFIKNFKRDFYVTLPAYRNHEQKKEEESLDRLRRYECTQSDLRVAVARALDKSWSKSPLQQLTSSPYLYGADISSTAIIKHDYMKRWPDAASGYSVAFFDIESDVNNGTNDPIMASIVFKDKIYQTILRDTVKKYSDPVSYLDKLAKEHLGKYIEKNNFQIEFEIVDTPLDVVKKTIMRAHEWSPDFLAIWNIDYDIPRIIETCQKYGMDPKDLFSDARVPKEYRFCKYKKGSTKKITASGQVKPKNPSEQWHSLLCPAGFYVIDAMCTYRFVRQGEQEQPYYKLDYILKLHLGVRKLNFEEASHIEDGSLAWHCFMQAEYPLQYAIYNIFDCIGMYELDAMNSDLQLSISAQSGLSDFQSFNSQTKRFADDYHFYLKENGYVIATIPPKEKDYNQEDMEEEESEGEVLSLRGWIVTLPSHLSATGRPVVKESPHIHSMIRTHVYDSDAVSAYPSCISTCNVSKSTTSKEIIDIVGVEEEVFRRCNMNLLLGHVNALDYAVSMYQLPKPQDALSLFDDM